MKQYLLSITKNKPRQTEDIYINAADMKEAIKRAAEYESILDPGIEKIEIAETL
jgi:hypothetical protein